MILQKIKDLNLRNKIVAIWGTVIFVVLLLYSVLFTNIYKKNEEQILGGKAFGTKLKVVSRKIW